MQDVTDLPTTPAAGLDIGATKTHIRFVAPGESEPTDITLRTGDHDSMESLIVSAFTAAGCVPRSVVAAVAGRVEDNGDIRVTNRREWPIFRHAPFVEKLGLELRLVNDLYSQLAGIGALDGSGREALTPTVDDPQTKAKVVLAMGSGIGGAFMNAVGRIHPTEVGHTTWQPVTDLEIALLRRLQLTQPGVVITLERTVAGLWGFDFLYDFVREHVAPGAEVSQHVAELREGQEPVGPAISVGAIADDPCCVQVMELYGSLIGQFMRNIALTCLIETGGAIYLSGSVMQKNSGAHTLIENTSMRDRFVSKGAEFSDFLSTIPFYLVTDGHVAVKGAYALASE